MIGASGTAQAGSKEVALPCELPFRPLLFSVSHSLFSWSAGLARVLWEACQALPRCLAGLTRNTCFRFGLSVRSPRELAGQACAGGGTGAWGQARRDGGAGGDMLGADNPKGFSDHLSLS